MGKDKEWFAGESIYDEGRIADVATFRGGVFLFFFGVFAIVFGQYFADFINWLHYVFSMDAPDVSLNKVQWYKLVFGAVGGVHILCSFASFFHVYIHRNDCK